jgi:hypothetical protein
VIDPEAESEILRQRSLELAEMLDAGHPVAERPEAVWAESRRLGLVATQARREVATRVANGKDPGTGVTVGRQPPIRRVKTDRRGHDLDPLHGRAAITPELVRFWEHRRDVVFPAVETSWRQAVEDRPYRDALVCAARGHLAVLGQRRSTSEGAARLAGALRAYDTAFENVRQAVLDSQAIATEATGRLAVLDRERAAVLVGEDNVKPLIASALGEVLDLPVDAGSLQVVGTPGRR